MSDRTPAEDATLLKCAGCGTEIERCHFCDETGCRSASCYVCVALALRETLRHPHAHGG